MPVYYIHVAVPIEPPAKEILACLKPELPEKFMFDEPSRFILFERSKDPVIKLAKDDAGQWYVLTYFTAGTLSSLKWARQSARPEYSEEEVPLPLVELLENEGFKPADSGFDKAYAHASVYLNELGGISTEKQARLANIDGDDDPRIIEAIHFFTNHFKGMKTRYIAGTETRSFATITENEPYFEDVHLKNNAFLYLLYFVYFKRYGKVPSSQMAPRLLENLWASRRSMCSEWNPSLVQTEKIES